LISARIGKSCLVGANALVIDGNEFADGSLIVVAPAKDGSIFRAIYSGWIERSLSHKPAVALAWQQRAGFH
jgi:carbonic anhydrase/acetyltransferase-like protein (isoleucine patch superfamily)